MHTTPCRARNRIRRALCHVGRQIAILERPERDEFGGVLDERTEIGRVAGYPYTKARASSNFVIALPGQLDENDQDGEYFMALYYGCRVGGDPLLAYDLPDAQKDDVLVFGDKCYRLLSVRDGFGVYTLYRIKEM